MVRGWGDHLVGWEVCCKPKKEGGLGLDNIVSKNKSLAAKWLWCFALHFDSYGTKSFEVSMVCT